MMNKKAFTLIELLVVVLIIGILAAIALPQYTRAVEKGRMAEALQIASSLRQAVDVYLLEVGYPKSGGDVLRLLDDSEYALSADITSQLNCTSGNCCSKHFCYMIHCAGGSGSMCDLEGWRYATSDGERVNYYTFAWHKSGFNSWERYYCAAIEDSFSYICRDFNAL